MGSKIIYFQLHSVAERFERMDPAKIVDLTMHGQAIYIGKLADDK